jgi:hypothetical protein
VWWCVTVLPFAQKASWFITSPMLGQGSPSVTRASTSFMWLSPRTAP